MKKSIRLTACSCCACWPSRRSIVALLGVAPALRPAPSAGLVDPQLGPAHTWLPTPRARAAPAPPCPPARTRRAPGASAGPQHPPCGRHLRPRPTRAWPPTRHALSHLDAASYPHAMHEGSTCTPHTYPHPSTHPHTVAYPPPMATRTCGQLPRLYRTSRECMPPPPPLAMIGTHSRSPRPIPSFLLLLESSLVSPALSPNGMSHGVAYRSRSR